MENEHLRIGVKISLLTNANKKEILSILKEHNQEVDSQTEIFDSPKDLPFFAQYGKLNIWGAVSKDILLSSIKIIEPEAFIKTIKE